MEGVEVEEGQGERRPFRRLLRDYPRNRWLRSADRCEACGAWYMVRIADLAGEGLYGDVEVAVAHGPDCPELGEGGGDELCMMAGWELGPEPVEFLGREYYPIVARADVVPCLECGRLIVSVPVVVFLSSRNAELAFCHSCAKKIGVFEFLKRGRGT